MTLKSDAKFEEDLWFGKRHEEFGKCSLEHSKVSKVGLWWALFAQSRKKNGLEFTEEELCVMTINNDTKIEEKMTCCFKIDMKNSKNFDPSTIKSWQWKLMQNLKRNRLFVSKLTWIIWRILTGALESIKSFLFNALLLCKVYIFWVKKVQQSYPSWHWRGIQNLERNRLFISKLTLGIWQILTWTLESLKNFNFNGLLLSKVYIVWAKKATEELSFMTLKNDAKFEEKLTRGLEKDIRNLANVHQSTQKCQNWDFDGLLLSKVEKFKSLKFTEEELCIMTINNDTKIEEKMTCCFKIDMKNSKNFDPSTIKSIRFMF